jgi:hypothetical protein
MSTPPRNSSPQARSTQAGHPTALIITQGVAEMTRQELEQLSKAELIEIIP